MQFTNKRAIRLPCFFLVVSLFEILSRIGASVFRLSQQHSKFFYLRYTPLVDTEDFISTEPGINTNPGRVSSSGIRNRKY